MFIGGIEPGAGRKLLKGGEQKEAARRGLEDKYPVDQTLLSALTTS